MDFILPILYILFENKTYRIGRMARIKAELGRAHPPPVTPNAKKAPEWGLLSERPLTPDQSVTAKTTFSFLKRSLARILIVALCLSGLICRV